MATTYSIGDRVTVTRPNSTKIPAGTKGTIADVIPRGDGRIALWITHETGANLAHTDEVDLT